MAYFISIGQDEVVVYRLFVSAGKNPYPILNLHYHHFPILFTVLISISHRRVWRYVVILMVWTMWQCRFVDRQRVGKTVFLCRSSFHLISFIFASFAGEWIFLDLWCSHLLRCCFTVPSNWAAKMNRWEKNGGDVVQSAVDILLLLLHSLLSHFYMNNVL